MQNTMVRGGRKKWPAGEKNEIRSKGKKCYRRKKEGKREKGKNWHFLTRLCQDDILYLLDDRCRKVRLDICVELVAL